MLLTAIPLTTMLNSHLESLVSIMRRLIILLIAILILAFAAYKILPMFNTVDTSTVQSPEPSSITPAPASTLQKELTEFFVDPNNMGGKCDDKNKGTIDAPFCTLRKGLTTLTSGKTLYLRGGIHRIARPIDIDGKIVKLSGTEKKYTQILNYNDEKPKLYLSLQGKNWQVHKDNIWKLDWKELTSKSAFSKRHNPQMIAIDDNPDKPILLQQVNFQKRIANTGANDEHKSRDCFIDKKGVFGIRSTKEMTPSRSNADDMIKGDFYFDEEKQEIFAWLPDSSNPNDHSIEIGVVSSIRFYNINHVKISGLEVRYSGSENTQCAYPTFVVKDGDHVTIENNIFSYNDTIGLGTRCFNCLIANNTMNYNGNSGINLIGENTIVENNTVMYNNWRGYYPHWHAGGIKVVSRDTNHLIIRNNHVAYNQSYGIWLDFVSDGNIIENNLVHNNNANPAHWKKTGVSQIHIESSNPKQADPSVIRNNIVSNCVRGIHLHGSNKIYIANNLINNCENAILVQNGNTKQHKISAGNRIINNILYNIRKSSLWIDSKEGSSDNRSDNNLFYSPSGDPVTFRLPGTGNELSLEEWQENTGNDKQSFISDPQFSNSSNDNFHLSKGSPAIDKGRNPAGAVPTDYEGTTRPQGKGYDIGPFEYR
jgi:parallel beta-helix repeat protein